MTSNITYKVYFHMIGDKKISQLDAKTITNFLNENIDTISQNDFDKVRRYCGLYTWKLKKKAKKDMPRFHYQFLVKCIELFSSYIDQNKGNWSEKNCGIYLNSLYWAALAADKEESVLRFVELAEQQISRDNLNNNDDIQLLLEFFEHNKIEELNHEITIISPTDFNLFANVVFDLLLAYGFKIERVVVKKITFDRVFSEVQRDGLKLIAKKVWNKMILKSDENSHQGILTFDNIYQGSSKSLKEKCASHKVSYESVNSFDDMKRSNGVAVFCGGGLLTVDNIKKFGKGVINTHMGILPKFRGMDVVEAAILNNDLNQVGLTCHLMNEGLDTGPILSDLPIDIRLVDNYPQLRNFLGVLMPFFVVKTLFYYLENDIKPIRQKSSGGLQNYFVSKRLYHACNIRIKNIAENSMIEKKLRYAYMIRFRKALSP